VTRRTVRRDGEPRASIADSLAAIALELDVIAKLIAAGGWDVGPLRTQAAALARYAGELGAGAHVRPKLGA
jgi:hypothetical protein